MQLSLFNKPLTFGLIPKMNNPHKTLSNIRLFMKYNLDKLDNIQGSNPVETESFIKANTELRLYKNIYKKLIKNKMDKQRMKDFQDFVEYELTPDYL